jgi:peptide/nickel transport system permease protein
VALKGFAGFAIRKASSAVITIFVIICANFLIFRLVPGDPIRLLFRDPRASAAAMAALRARFGLDGTLWDQFVAYLRQLFLHRDMGLSFVYGEPVWDVIAGRIPQTLLLVLIGLFIAGVVGTLLGAMAGWKTGTKFDSVVVSFSLSMYSIPTFAMGIILLMIFAVTLGLFPLGGMYTRGADLTGWAYVRDVARYLVLPTAAIIVWYLGQYVIITRSSMQDVLDQDYIAAARTKGLKESTVLRRHALRNAILPVVTITGLDLAFAIAGVIQVETVFRWPGIGRLMYESVLKRDYPVLQGLFLVFAVVIVLANLLVDLTYGYLDPRIKVGGGS